MSETELPKSQVSRTNFYFISYVSRIFISGIHHPDDCFHVESLRKGRQARLGIHHSNLQPHCYAGDRAQTGLVDYFIVDPHRQHPLSHHRCSPHLPFIWPRRRIYSRAYSFRIYFLPNAGFWWVSIQSAWGLKGVFIWKIFTNRGSHSLFFFALNEIFSRIWTLGLEIQPEFLTLGCTYFKLINEQNESKS